MPDRGTWILRFWPPYFAVTTRPGYHFHVGVRWDDIDKYYSLSVAVKRY